MAGKVSVLGICAIPCALPLSYRSLYDDGTAIIMLGHSFYEHTTV